MNLKKTLLTAALVAASFGASAQVTGSTGGGAGTFLELAGGSGGGPVYSCATTACTLGGTFGTIVGGSTLTSDQVFADANGFTMNGGVQGGTTPRFLSAGPTTGTSASGPTFSSTLTFSPSSTVDYISFLWGSPDTYNTLTVNTTGGAPQTFTALSLGLGNTTGSQTFSQYVQFASVGMSHISSLVFSSTSDAFEVANFSVTPVPEPETYALMLAGLGALGFIARRRKRV